VVTGAPAFTPPVEAGRTPNPTGAFDPFDSKVTTKLTRGTLVGEYQILERIGEGGMGTVYSAVHPIIGKKVAIKVLAGRLANNKNAIRRFVLEARTVNDIRHPGLVDIFSFGQLTDGRHYYVMEYLAGRNLGDVLRARLYLPMAEAVPIFLEVGDALVAVHAKGIVHRDLKPENILLLSATTGQRAKLVDFGLAKLLEGVVPAHLSEGGPRTAAGVNVGTPHYMSPEQCRGQKVDARSDLYALGVLLYETLTGRVPFDGATPLDIWQAHVEKPPRPPAEVCPATISPAMNSLVLRLLAKQPEHRVQSASEFCTALRNLGDDSQDKLVISPASSAELPVDMRTLARALSGKEGAVDLVALDVAALRGPIVDLVPPKKDVGAKKDPVAPKPERRVLPEELTTTTKDLPIMQMPDDLKKTTKDIPVAQMPEVAFNEAERREEIEELRTSLGLHIDEPASDSQEEAQMSALAIDLAPKGSRDGETTDRTKSGRIPVVSSAGLKVRPGMRPIEERNRQLAPPSPGKPAQPASEPRSGRVVLVVIVTALLLAATVAAVLLVR
jgi:serine/threonine protein kinase